MNVPEMVVVAILATFYSACHFAPQSLKDRALSPIRRWWRPLAERLFPALKLEPWLFEPIAAEDLPPKQRQHFETHGAAFVARGFTPLGDFVMRRDCRPSCIRYFLSRDRMTIGEAACYLDTYTFGCMSVLLDGFYIESGNLTLPQLPPAEHGLQFCPFKTDDAVALIEHHLACVAKTAAARGTAAAPLAASDLQAAVNHGRQLSLRSLHGQGFLEELPEFLREQAGADSGRST